MRIRSQLRLWSSRDETQSIIASALVATYVVAIGIAGLWLVHGGSLLLHDDSHNWGQHRMRVVIAVCLGLLAGMGGYTFVYARGYSYLTNDPAACANCHVMRDHFVAWTRSSHANVATCNDCHTPPGVIAKYATKAENGFWHSFTSPRAITRTRCASRPATRT
jgi:hypothetical protein